MTKNIYYIYKHIKTSTNTVFYVGRGKYNLKGASYETIRTRAYSKSGRNNWWTKIINKHEYSVEIVADNLTFEEACALEKELVSYYGRMDIGTGTLCNLCEGGEGTPDRIVKRKTLRECIDDNVAYIPITGCWIWTGSVIAGRLIINTDNKSANAKRYIYENLKGDKLTIRRRIIPTCGHSDCVNPDHMKVIRRTNSNAKKKLTEEDKIDAKRLLTYFYPSEISYLFPNIAENTLKGLSSKLKPTKVKIEQDWGNVVENQSTKHLTVEDIVDMRRLDAAGVGSQTISQLYNLHRTKVTGIINGYRGLRFFKNL